MNSIARLRKLPPALKGLIFTFMPLAYYLFDKLNYSQAGLSAVLGFFTLTTLFYWRDILPNKRALFSGLLLSFLIIILLNIGFQSTLRDAFGVQQEDVIVVQSIFSTDMAESSEFFIQYARYISLNLALFLGSLVLFWFLFVAEPPSLSVEDKPKIKRYWAAGIVTIVLLAIHFNPTLRKSNPLFYFPENYLRWQADLEEAKQLYAHLAATNSDETLNSMVVSEGVGRRTVVVVIGESDTRNDWSLYGYERETTPLLEKVDGLIVFEDVIAADASTIGSITRMLTPATVEQGELWKEKPSVVVMAQRAGYKVYWVTNQGTEGRGIVSILAGQADRAVFTNRGGSRLEGTLDEAVLDPYRAALNDPAEKKLIFVHILGSHPSYNYRYPRTHAVFEKLYDDAVAERLASQGRSMWEITFRNMYDSAIYYQDYILSQLVNELIDHPNEPAAWLYISDHGQDVAHNSDFSGHNRRAKEMWEVPMLLWSNDHYELPVSDIAALKKRPYQADDLEHAILGLLDIEGGYYDSGLDIFSADYDLGRNFPRHLRGSGLDYR
ncbi:MAG TPA: phosphoethanolamine transferase [Gammaproteobacteria bacterium]|nr:phosphoethanolamine transferase [Gammaproteobacteria bacterium]